MRSTLACAVLAALTGCGSPARICTGGTGVQLVAYLAGGFVPYSVQGELGSSFLQIDGSCGFAVRLAEPLAPELAGRLDGAMEREVSDRLSFGSWPGLAGRYASQISDTAVLVLDSATTPETDILCDDCSARATPILGIAHAYPEVLADVAALGVEATGAVRYRVWGPVEDPGGPVVDGSIAPIDLAAVAQPTPPTRDEVRVTTSDAEADGLRALRRAARLAGARWIATRDGAGNVFDVDLRTVLPSEGSAPSAGVH